MRFDNNTVAPPDLGSGSDGKKTIHNVFILDRSDSMRDNSKYRIAVNSMNEELNILKQDNSVNYTNTIIEFDYAGQDITHFYKVPLSQFTVFKGAGPRGMTALYDCTGNTLTRLMNETTTDSDERVLIKIFTDGVENNSNKFRHGTLLKDLIAKAQEIYKFTITFIGTETDVQSMIKNMGIDKTNTLSHNNTAESVLRSVNIRTNSTIAYGKAVASGASADSLTSNFFKSISK